MSSRTPLGRAHILASSVSREIRRAGIPVEELVPVGGIRRFAPEVGEVALLALVAPTRIPHVIKAIGALPIATGVLAVAAAGITIATERGPATIHIRAPEQAGAALVWHTGSRAHLEQLQARAAERGLLFDAAGLTRDGTILPMPTEAEFYAALDLPAIPPELREGRDELVAAGAGRLPALVADMHVRGDLHMHTLWSDGRDRIEDMAGVARQLGYEYIAITDHSEHAMSSRTLAADAVARQRAEVDEVRARIGGLQILHGVEVDIMPDGSLDFSDDLLEGFDLVLASLHDAAGHDRERLTARYLSALRHPLVNVITHPANRSPAFSQGYDVDFDRVFAAAVDTGTALEIDGAPGHLDMDGVLARRAIAAGVTVTLDSDAHRAEWLGRQMRFAVGTARRGWVEPRHVLNARSVTDVRAFVARKRARD